MNMNKFDYVAWVLIVIGGLNWGLVGVFEFNLVDALFGEGSGLAKTVYILVGLAALYSLLSVVAKAGKAKKL